jgi:hypothetical protein
LHSNPDLGLRNCRGVLGHSGLKESKQKMGMATEFQSRPCMGRFSDAEHQNYR